MPNADELLASGDIQEARAALISQVRSEPGNIPVRMFLFQLFALTGEWKRAKDQLETLAKLDAEMRMLSVAYSQCIDAEIERASVFSGDASIPFLSKTDWGDSFAASLMAHAKGDAGAAKDILIAHDVINSGKGSAGEGQSFDWISDGDPRFGANFEVCIAGRYGLMPFSSLEVVKIYKPRDLRDTIWVQAEFGMRQGAKIAGFIFVRYPNSHASDDGDIVRGQATDWSEQNGLEIGHGHRLLMMSDGSEQPLLNFENITLEVS